MRTCLAWILCLCAAAAPGGFTSAGGCDTPVYRYALYRWAPATYHLYEVQSASCEDGQAPSEVKGTLVGAMRDARRPVNLRYVPVDLSAADGWSQVPDAVRQAWESVSGRPECCHLLVNPHGAVVFDGWLSLDELSLLLDSPARSEIEQSLAAGKSGVLVLVADSRSQDTASAEQAVTQTLSAVTSRRAFSASVALSNDVELGLVRVERHDPREKWLVQSLLRLEPTFPSPDQPQLFLVFGRGRAVFSCMGQEITTDNIVRDVQYVTGACGSTDRALHPGTDLLMRADWHSAAIQVAQRFGPEEGNDRILNGDLAFPELVLQGQAEALERIGQLEGSEVERPLERLAGAGAVEPLPPVGSDLDLGPWELARRGPEFTQPPETAGTQPVDGGWWKVAAGIGLALIGLFATTWMVLRPQ